MNKPMIRAHIGDMLAELAQEFGQPKLHPSYILLTERHKQGDTYIDLYGTFDADGYEVMDYTLAGSLVPLWDLQSAGSNVLASLSDWCSEFLPSADERKEDARQEARAGQAEARKEALFD